MANRKVLLPTYFFPPCGAVAVHRMIAFARYLPEFGWDPIIIAPPCARFEIEDPTLLDRVPAETTVIRVPFPQGFAAKLRERFDPLSSWLPVAYQACKEALSLHQPDALLTSSPPPAIHRLGMKLKRLTKLPWALELRDPWSLNLYPGIKVPFPWKQIERKRERAAFRAADLLIANTPMMREGMTTTYPDLADKTILAPNGFDPEMFPDHASPKRRDRVQLVYAGEIYVGRDPRPLLDAIAEHKRQPIAGLPPIEMVFFGRNTQGVFDLDEEIRKRDLGDRVTNKGQVPYREALDAMLQADIVVTLQSPNCAMGVPAKVYEYLGAKKPILATGEPDGDVAWVLRESGVLHRIVPTSDSAAIRQALFDLVGDVVRGQEPHSDDDRLSRFTRRSMAATVASGLDWMMAGGKLSELVEAGAAP